MNQIAAPRIQYDANAKFPPLPSHFHAPAGIGAGLGRNVAEGLQLTRAITIALTRLQLALAGGDRRQAMAAIDRLHVLDGKIAHLVEGLPQSPNGKASPSDGGGKGPCDDLLLSLDEHLKDQKLALAFEKLALASGISGADLVSANHPLALEGDGRLGHQAGPASPADQEAENDHWPASAHGEPPLVDWHPFSDVQTVIWDRVPPKVWGMVLTALVAAACAMAAAVVNMI